MRKQAISAVNVAELKKLAKDFKLTPDKIFIPFRPQEQPSVPTPGGETLSPEEDAQRQAEAEAQVAGGGGAEVPI